jgi:hypothetical protein
VRMKRTSGQSSSTWAAFGIARRASCAKGSRRLRRGSSSSSGPSPSAKLFL